MIRFLWVCNTYPFAMSASTPSMLDFFRWNCSWYISGITKGNDRSQSIPSRAHDLWPARPFVIVVWTTDLGWIIVSSSCLAMSSFDFIFFWMEGLIKQTMLIPYESQRRKDMNKCFENWLQSCTMINSLTLESSPFYQLLHNLYYFSLVLILRQMIQAAFVFWAGNASIDWGVLAFDLMPKTWHVGGKCHVPALRKRKWKCLHQQ